MKTLKKAILHASFVLLAFSLFVVPLHLELSKSLFSNFLKEVEKIPNNYSLFYETNIGFSSNPQNPIDLQFQKGTKHFVIDPYSKFNGFEKNSNYFILRKKGVLFYKGSNFISNSPIDFADNLTISKNEILEFAKSIVEISQTPFFVIFLLLGTYLQVVVDFLFVAIFYALIGFLILKSQKNKITFSESLIKVLYLAKFFVIGRGLDIVFETNFLGTLILTLGIGVTVIFQPKSFSPQSTNHR